jgi:uncharacterized protein (TIGR03086 family)
VDVTELYERVSQGFRTRLHALTPEQWALPTPCTEWNVRDIVNHTVWGQSWVVPLCAGLTVEEVGNRFEGDLLGEDPIGAWEKTIRSAIDAFDSPEAQARVIELLAYGTVTGQDFGYDIAMDLHVHTWDISRAVGGDEQLDPELNAAVHDWLASVDVDRDNGFSLPRLRLKGLFAPRVETPPGADVQTRLLAITGRRSF